MVPEASLDISRRQLKDFDARLRRRRPPNCIIIWVRQVRQGLEDLESCSPFPYEFQQGWRAGDRCCRRLNIVAQSLDDGPASAALAVPEFVTLGIRARLLLHEIDSGST
jgi:hypothetical protein